MVYEHTSYCCEYCDQEFDSLTRAKNHEENCDENPNNLEDDQEEYQTNEE